MNATSSMPVLPSRKPPLRLLVLFHPRADRARALALDVHRRFMAAAAAPGLRIPVAFLPERDDDLPETFDVEAAEHTLVIALVDARMAQRAREVDRRSADAWAERIVQTRASLKDGGRHGVLLAALDGGAFGLDLARLGQVSFIRLDVSKDQENELAFQVAVSALRLLRKQELPDAPVSQAPVELFVSHSKSDLPVAENEVVEGPVKELLAWLAQGPVSGWYDAKKIRSGEAFPKTITEGVERCDAFVCMLTDHWSEREWCRRELLVAKRAGKPILLVDALTGVVPRLFSYVGNARTLRWTPSDPKTVALAAVLEALRHLHARQVLEQRKRPGDVVLGTLPEALTLRALAPKTTTILYPDPPLPLEELTEISPVHVIDAASNLASQVTLSTPLQRLAEWQRPTGADLVGLSLSGASDIQRWGASEDHLATFADDIVTMLLVAGLRLGYGGVFDHGGVKNDSVNYTTRLFGLVRSYFTRVEELRASRIHPIENYVPWPIHLGYDDSKLQLYGQEARLKEGPTPPRMPLAELGVDEKGRFKRETPVQQWAYALGGTAMRERMNEDICARVALAGKLEGFNGTIPGVIEEILIARGARPDGDASAARSTRPLFLIGAFGGATRLAIEQLLPGPTREVPGGNAMVLSEFAKLGAPYWTPAGATAALRTLATSGPAAALGNGLDDAANKELFFSTDTQRLVELILLGLGRTFGAA
jgi:hypothetical protein